MPRGKQAETSKGKTGRNEDFKGYAQILISSEDEELIEAWLEGNPLWATLVDAIDSGYKFSLTYNVKGKSYIATLYGASERTGPNHGWSLSGFGNEAESAVISLLFKHFHVKEGMDWGGTSGIQLSQSKYR